MGLPANFWEKDGVYSWIILGVMVLNSTMVGLLYTVLAVMTSEYSRLLGIEQSQANLVGSVLLGVFLLTVPLNALLVSTFNLRICAGIGSVFAIGGVLASAFAFDLWFLIVGFSLCAGYGVSMLWTATIKVVPHYFKTRQKMAYMATGIGYGLGRAVFPYILTSILKATDYKSTMLYTTIFFAFSMTAPIFYKEQLAKDRHKTAGKLLKAYTHPLKRYIAPFHLANGYLWNAELTGVAVILFTYIEKTTHSIEVAATVATINGAMQMVGAIGLTLLLMKVKLNHYILQIVFNILIGGVCFVLAAYKNEYSFYVTAGILGFMEAIMVGNITCVCHHLYPERDVVYAFGFHETLGGLAGFIAPYTAGLIQEKWGDEIGFYYLGSNSILGGIILILAGLIRKSTWTHRPIEEDDTQTDTPTDTQIDTQTDTEASSGIPEKRSISSDENTRNSSTNVSVSVEKSAVSLEEIKYIEDAASANKPSLEADSTKL